MFANRVLRKRISASKEKVVGDWRRLNNKDLHNV
jgi:hypothetical protein